MKVALYGGSFDPFHNSHLETVKILLAKGFDEVWVVPTKEHAFDSKKLSPFEARQRMAEKALQGLSAAVLERDEVYTYDMVVNLMEEHPEAEITVVMGADCLLDAKAGKWRHWDRLTAIADVLAFGREGYPLDDVDTALPNISSTEIRTLFQRGMPADHLLPPGIVEVVREYDLYGSNDGGGLARTTSTV